MNFKEYQLTTEQLETKLIKSLPFWEVRRFLPNMFISGTDLYLTPEGSADGMNTKDLLLFIRYMITFGGYTKEEIFNETQPETRDSTELESCTEDDDYGPSSEEERLVRLAQSLLNGDGKLG